MQQLDQVLGVGGAARTEWRGDEATVLGIRKRLPISPLSHHSLPLRHRLGGVVEGPVIVSKTTL
jgi:hypothetical protein